MTFVFIRSTQTSWPPSWFILCVYIEILYCLFCSVTETSHNATKSPITGICPSPSRICAVRKLECCSEYGSSPRKNCNNFSYGVSQKAADNGDRTVLLDTPKIIALLSQGLNTRKYWIKLGKGSFGTVIQAKHKGLLFQVEDLFCWFSITNLE